MTEIKPVYTCDMQSVSGVENSSSSQQPALIDESIFSTMDKDNNGSVSAEEAKNYGFCAWEIKEDLKKSDFEAKVKTFNEQTLAKSKENRSTEDTDNDFKHHFQTPSKDGNIVHDVTLSYEEQQTLLKRMNDFEQYKAGLSDEDKTELEKNKSSMLDFAFKNWDRGEEYKTYDEFQQYNAELKSKIITNLKAGKTTTLSNEELSQVLYATDTTDLVSDGKLGSSAQGMSGDCWALSQLNNYAQTKEGAENIANRIKQNNDGTYTVTFQNPLSQNEQKQYTVTKDELKNFGINNDTNKAGIYSAGDLDTRIYEIATGKMLNEFAPQEDNTINGGSPVKRVLLHKAMGYKSDIVTYQRYLEEDTKLAAERKPEPIKNSNNEAKEYAPQFFEDTIKENKNAVFAITYGLTKKGQLTTDVKVEKNCENLSDVLKNHPELKAENLTCNTQLHKDTGKTSKNDRYIQGGHVYNMRSLDRENGTVVLQDPYNSSFPIAITQDRFANKYENDKNAHDFVRLTYFPSEIKYTCK